MSKSGLAAAIVSRATRARIEVPPPLADALASYVELLARWNRTINLTALPIAPPTDAAIDRLIVEPLAATQRLRETDRSVIDIGSGGGSPAIPMKLARPALRFVLVEMKVRKSAFLREAARELGLTEVDVEAERIEDLAAADRIRGRFDVATIRAVRLNESVAAAIRDCLAPDGRLFWFGGGVERTSTLRGFEATPTVATGFQLVVLKRIIDGT